MNTQVRLLVSVAGPSPQSGISLLAEANEDEFDWDHLIGLARWHRLLPLLHSNLKGYGIRIPDRVNEALCDQIANVAFKNLQLAGALLEISSLLSAHGIDHAAYKGPVLAEELYGSLALRISCDLDILVRPENLSRTRELFKGVGVVDKNGFTGAQQAALLRFGFEQSFRNPEGVEVDLHWRVTPTFASSSFDSEGTWRRIRPALLSGHTVPTLCPEDLLVALCLHAGHHEWSHLSHFADISRLLQRHRNLDWDLVSRHLSDSNTERTVFSSLAIVDAHWGSDIPTALLKRILSDRPVTAIIERARQFWAAAESHLPANTDVKWLLDRTSGERLRDRMRYVFGIAFNPTEIDYRLFRLPYALIPLYPTLRTIRLVFERCRRARTALSTLSLNRRSGVEIKH